MLCASQEYQYPALKYKSTRKSWAPVIKFEGKNNDKKRQILYRSSLITMPAGSPAIDGKALVLECNKF